MTSTIQSASASLPGAIQSIFDKAKSVAASIRDLADLRDKAEVSLKVAADNFDTTPDRKTLDSLGKARAELERLSAAVPDDAAAIESAKARIFSDPASWLALSEALSAHAEKFDVAAKIARTEFAASVESYILSGGDCPTLVLENRFGGLATEALRDRMKSLEDRRDYLTGKANRARYISQGEPPGEITFESMAAHLESKP